jgi:hypothetical protein
MCHLHLAPSLRLRGAIPPHSIHLHESRFFKLICLQLQLSGIYTAYFGRWGPTFCLFLYGRWLLSVFHSLLPHGVKDGRNLNIQGLGNVEPHISVYHSNFSKARMSSNVIEQMLYLSCYLNSNSVGENVGKYCKCILSIAFTVHV